MGSRLTASLTLVTSSASASTRCGGLVGRLLSLSLSSTSLSVPVFAGAFGASGAFSGGLGSAPCAAGVVGVGMSAADELLDLPGGLVPLVGTVTSNSCTGRSSRLPPTTTYIT